MIALGLDSAKKITHFQKSILRQEGFSNLMASSTTLQLDKSLWPSQILLVCKGSATPETQTLPAPNHTPYGTRYMVEHAYSTGVVHVLCEALTALHCTAGSAA